MEGLLAAAREVPRMELAYLAEDATPSVLRAIDGDVGVRRAAGAVLPLG